MCCADVSGLRLSQRKTLGHLVVGAMRCRRASLADLGRSMLSETSAKHCIKRVWRFLRNERVVVSDGARALLALAGKASRGRLVVAVDWVDVRQDHVLRAATPLRGRSVPLLAAAYRKWGLHRSQNALEDAFFVLLKSLLPERTDAVIVADRGFARAGLARKLQGLRLGYVIRVNRGVHFAGQSHTGALSRLALSPGKHRDFGFGWYRQRRPVHQRIVAWWKRHDREPWFLATNLDWAWRKICHLYGLRMQKGKVARVAGSGQPIGVRVDFPPLVIPPHADKGERERLFREYTVGGQVKCSHPWTGQMQPVSWGVVTVIRPLPFPFVGYALDSPRHNG